MVGDVLCEVATATVASERGAELLVLLPKHSRAGAQRWSAAHQPTMPLTPGGASLVHAFAFAKLRTATNGADAPVPNTTSPPSRPTSPAPVFQPPWLQNSSAARPSTAPAFAVRNASPDVTRVSTPASTLCGAHVAELYSRLDALRLAANRSSTARPALGGSSLATASTGDTSALRADLIATELQQARRRVSK